MGVPYPFSTNPKLAIMEAYSLLFDWRYRDQLAISIPALEISGEAKQVIEQVLLCAERRWDELSRSLRSLI